MDHLKQYFEWMGKPVKDRIRGTEGIVTSINFDLYGCVQVCITPKQNADGKAPEQVWCDVQRLSADDNAEPVIPLPQYLFSTRKQEHQNGPPGASEKPGFPSE